MVVAKDRYTAHMMVLDAEFKLLADQGQDGVLDEKCSDGTFHPSAEACDVVDYEDRSLSSSVGGNGFFTITFLGEEKFGEVAEQSGELTLHKHFADLLIGSGNGEFKVQVGETLLKITVENSRPTSCEIV